MTQNRSTRTFIAGVLLLCSAPAFARGGPGAAFADALAAALMTATVVGIVVGVALRNKKWISHAFLLGCVLFGALMVLPKFSSGIRFLGFLLSLSLMLVAATAISFRAPMQAVDAMSGTKTKRVVEWLCITGIAWTMLSFYNYLLLGPVPLTVLGLFDSNSYLHRFVPFFLPPLITSTIVAAAFTFILTRRKPKLDARVAPWCFNATLLIAFIALGNIYKGWLIADDLKGHSPKCVVTSSFLSDLSAAGKVFRPPHDSYSENGRHYHWSYSELRFVDAGESGCH